MFMRLTREGLDFFEVRYLSGAQGRFTSPDEPLTFADPENPQTWNLYAYGLNNPLLYSDPSGHNPCVNGVNPETGNMCTTGTSTAPGLDPIQELILGRLVNTLVTMNRVAEKTQELAQPVVDWFNQPRNPMCMANYVGAGSTIGAWGGGLAGAEGIVTIPVFSAGGAGVGGAAGGLVGMAACSSASGGGGSVGGGGGNKRPKPGVSGKEGAKDVPSWAKGQRPRIGESGKEFAKRLLDSKYGSGNYDKGPTSEFNRIQKWGIERSSKEGYEFGIYTLAQP